MAYSPGDLSKLFNPDGGAPSDIQALPTATKVSPFNKADLAGLTKHQRKKIRQGKLTIEEARGETAEKPIEDEKSENNEDEKNQKNQKNDKHETVKPLSRKERAAKNLEKIQKSKERQKAAYVGKGEDLHTKDDRLDRTIFVGNVPVSTKEKEIKKLFSEHGPIESLRFRSLSRSDPKISKRAAFAKKEFHEERAACNVYIVFKEEGSAEKSLAMNGSKIDGEVIRVDMAGNSKKNDNQNSIFVGNLDFKAQEDDVRTFFMTCGKITNVRLVRDNFSAMGKGFGFVSFESAASVRSAITFDGSKFEGRALRVYKSVEKPKKFTKKSQTNDKKSAKKKTTGKKGMKRYLGSWEGEQAKKPNQVEGQKRKKQKHASRNKKSAGKTPTENTAKKTKTSTKK